ncbi:MAG: HPF/RaiA family ribosome-associated protein [Myxococcota bacterium]
MELAVRGHNLFLSDQLEHLVRRRLDFALGRFASRIRRIDVKFDDVNGPRGGVDKRCQVDVTLSRGGQVRAHSMAESLRDAIDEAAHRVVRRLNRQLSRPQASRHASA